MLIYIKKPKIVYVGIWLESNTLYIAWLFEATSFITYQFDLELARTNLDQMIKQKIFSHYPKQKIILKFITAAPLHCVWYKNLILQQDVNIHNSFTLVSQIIANELPIGLEQLHIDYNYDYLEIDKNQQSYSNLTIMAIKQDVLRDYLATYALDIYAIDIIPYAILRAFNFYYPFPQLNSVLWIYQIADFNLIMQIQSHGLIWLASPQSDLTLLYNEFKQKYPNNSTVDNWVIANSTPVNMDLAADIQLTSHKLTPKECFIATGLALWQPRTE